MSEAWDFTGAAAGRTEPPMVIHRGGVPWYEAPVPRRWHRCRTQTGGSVDGLVWTQRCACGAIRSFTGPWLERNSRRKATR